MMIIAARKFAVTKTLGDAPCLLAHAPHATELPGKLRVTEPNDALKRCTDSISIEPYASASWSGIVPHIQMSHTHSIAHSACARMWVALSLRARARNCEQRTQRAALQLSYVPGARARLRESAIAGRNWLVQIVIIAYDIRSLCTFDRKYSVCV